MRFRWNIPANKYARGEQKNAKGTQQVEGLNADIRCTKPENKQLSQLKLTILWFGAKTRSVSEPEVYSKSAPKWQVHHPVLRGHYLRHLKEQQEMRAVVKSVWSRFV